MEKKDMASKEIYVPRVTQFDAVELDDEIHKILKNQIGNVTKFMKVGFLGRWEPEVDALLRLIIWKFSVNKEYGTFGQQLLSFKYGGEFNQHKAYLFALLTVGSKYLKHRSHEIASAASNPTMSEKIKLVFHWADFTIQLASLVNLLVFLMEGQHPTLVDRILGLRPVSVAPPGQGRSVGYNYMTRELLWHGLIELFVFVVPLINYHVLKRRMSNLFSWRRKDVGSRGVVFTTSSRCAECNDTPILPHHMGCGHIFCFYCIKANHLADQKYECPLCGFSSEDDASIRPVHF